ncbi:Calnexin like protein [Tritrichomonas foetus]|uniref:Calnexin like protein n=1 Tax=Tritrichomonas foetus TaxID=1144522 RepID=A0A1J4J735_9EUKA|nr:Calnexin like protein [Tritrichomonas foetus]|eukprot:OHS94976.1 Calnexin like protein [Tritrichomonas foetus]
MVIFFVFLASSLPDFPLEPSSKPFFFESFQNESFKERWQNTNFFNYTGVFEHRNSSQPQGYKNEYMLYSKNPSSYYGYSTLFDKPLNLLNKTLVIQYETRFDHKMTCSGAYVKLFQKDNFHPSNLTNETNYLIMFGPDLCFMDSKVQFIFKHKNWKSGKYEEKRLIKNPPVSVDKYNHLFTLISRPDNSFEIFVDGNSVKSGSLLEDFDTPVKSKKMIPDPNDKVPDDWTDQEYIPDPFAKKPSNWDDSQPKYIQDPSRLDPPEGWLVDEPLIIPDPEAKKPEDWDDDLNGEWEPPSIRNPKCAPDISIGCGPYDPPLIKNPKYRGKWTPPLIENPKFIGHWKPRKIPNPYYIDDQNPHNFEDIIGVGFELFLNDPDIGFENLYIGTDEEAVHEWNREHFLPKSKIQHETPKIKDPAKKAAKEKESQDEYNNQMKYLRQFQQPGETNYDDMPFYNLSGKLKALYQEFYDENKSLTIVCTLLTLMFPFILFGIACC